MRRGDTGGRRSSTTSLSALWIPALSQEPISAEYGLCSLGGFGSSFTALEHPFQGALVHIGFCRQFENACPRERIHPIPRAKASNFAANSSTCRGQRSMIAGARAGTLRAPRRPRVLHRASRRRRFGPSSISGRSTAAGGSKACMKIALPRLSQNAKGKTGPPPDPSLPLAGDAPRVGGG